MWKVPAVQWHGSQLWKLVKNLRAFSLCKGLSLDCFLQA